MKAKELNGYYYCFSQPNGLLQPADIKNIRVLLLSDDGTNIRSDVYLKCSTNANITCGDETKSAGSEELLHPADTLTMAPGKTYIVKPESEDVRSICAMEMERLYQMVMRGRLRCAAQRMDIRLSMNCR